MTVKDPENDMDCIYKIIHLLKRYRPESRFAMHLTANELNADLVEDDIKEIYKTFNINKAIVEDMMKHEKTKQIEEII